MFWSLILHPSKRYSSTVKEAFHLSMAALDPRTSKNDTEINSVFIEIEGQELLLCNLSKAQYLQAPLDLMFQKGSQITFFTNGKANVHLTGYLLQEDDFSDLSDEEEELDDEEMSLSSKGKNVAQVAKPAQATKQEQSPTKRKLAPASPIAAKKKQKVEAKKSLLDDLVDDSGSDVDENKLGKLIDSITEDDDDDSDDDSFSIEDDDSADSDDVEASNEADSDALDSDEDDEDDDDDEGEDESDEDSDDEEVVKPNNVATPKSNTKENKENTKVQSQNKNAQSKTPQSNKKPDIKQGKPNQSLTNGLTPVSGKKDKNKHPDTPTPELQKSQKKGNVSTPQSAKKQTLEGGVIVEETKPGNGPVAKAGKMVSVYYTGRLKHNNRVFDQSNQGGGFKFRLGKNEVIKGWDVGINGMVLGSKRRLTIPPHMAYGAKGSPPQIPPNSTLVFDVELKTVN